MSVRMVIAISAPLLPISLHGGGRQRCNSISFHLFYFTLILVALFLDLPFLYTFDTQEAGQ